jgi:hypothetical protein
MNVHAWILGVLAGVNQGKMRSLCLKLHLKLLHWLPVGWLKKAWSMAQPSAGRPNNWA